MKLNGIIKRNRIRKKGRLHRQISTIFIGSLLLSILAILFVNGMFLERFYVAKKSDILLDMMMQLEQLDIDSALQENDMLDTEDLPADVRDYSYKNNLSWIILTKDNLILGHGGESSIQMGNQLFGYIYNLDTVKRMNTVLDETDQYVLQEVHDRFQNLDFLEIWGTFMNGSYFMIRTPLESIRESVEISNTFYCVVGVVIVFVSGLAILLLSKRITRPIRELTDLSVQMTGLDFEARYKSEAGNEIDVLGDSFNRMCDRLEQTISELKTANHELEKDIEAKIKIDEMRKEFIDNVSHELKTPIALIQGYAEGLKDNISDDPESREFYCDVIMDEAQKMNKLVKNLLILNKLESGHDAVTLEHFDLVSLIRGVLASMDIMCRQAEAEVIFQEEEPVFVWADEFKTEQVVTNYLSNAIHHIGGENKIEIRIHKEEERVRVTVFNTGTPIPEEAIPKLWNKFYKVDKAHTREYGGSGIGLSIVKAVLEAMGQEYGVTNYDNGVEFYFTLSRR